MIKKFNNFSLTSYLENRQSEHEKFEDFDVWVPKYFKFKSELSEILSEHSSRKPATNILPTFLDKFHSVDSFILYCKKMAFNSADREFQMDGRKLDEVEKLKKFYLSWIKVADIDIDDVFNDIIETLQDMCDENNYQFTFFNCKIDNGLFFEFRIHDSRMPFYGSEYLSSSLGEVPDLALKNKLSIIGKRYDKLYESIMKNKNRFDAFSTSIESVTPYSGLVKLILCVR